MQVDGDTSTNDTVIALSSGLSGSRSNIISSLKSREAGQLQECLDVVCISLLSKFWYVLLRSRTASKDFFFSRFYLKVMQGLAKSIAWDGEGATCLIEVCISINKSLHSYAF